MSTAKKLPERPAPAAREVRFCLKDMLQEVAEERQTGAFGTEKLHQKDIRKLFRSKTRPARADAS
jgi:hypothetical protein